MAAPATTSTQRVAPKKKSASIWQWEAKNKSGEIKKGEMEASDSDAVHSRLRSLGLNPEKVKKKPLEINFKIPGMGGVGGKDLLSPVWPMERSPSSIALPQQSSALKWTRRRSGKSSLPSRPRSNPAPPSRMRSRTTPRCSMSSTRSCAPRARWAVFSTPFSTAWRCIGKRRKSSSAKSRAQWCIRAS